MRFDSEEIQTAADLPHTTAIAAARVCAIGASVLDVLICLLSRAQRGFDNSLLHGGEVDDPTC
jgi:hypothetical protein